MPMFGFVCPDCNETFEQWVPSFSAVDQVTCPQCESDKVEKQLSRVARMSSSGSSSTLSQSSSSTNCAPGG